MHAAVPQRAFAHLSSARKTVSRGVMEGFNNRLKLTTRKSYGFRRFRAVEVALYHTLGALPEPESTHRFC